MPYEFGDVVLVQFPFTNQKVFKKRPAVVVSNKAYNDAKPDVVIMAITSQLRSSGVSGEVWIKDWQAARLLKPSAVKPVFATLEKSILLAHLGTLSSRDRARRGDCDGAGLERPSGYPVPSGPQLR
nr:type II toxin-antitoxin system PemK/MazF family toxin [Acidobacteriaceae bacterium]